MGNAANFTTPPPLRGTSPYTGEAFRKRHSNPFLAHRPQPVRRPSSGGRISGSRAAALVGVHRLETVALFRFLFGDKKEGLSGKMPFSRQRHGKPTPPPLRGTSPYTGEAFRGRERLPCARGGIFSTKHRPHRGKLSRQGRCCSLCGLVQLKQQTITPPCAWPRCAG